MVQVLAGEIGHEASILARSDIALHRIFESEEIGLFHLALAPKQRVPIGHDLLVSLVLCLAGRVAVIQNGDAATIEVGSYAVIPEGERAALAAQGEAAKVLLFLGVEQLPGAFFNSYGPADV